MQKYNIGRMLIKKNWLTVKWVMGRNGQTVQIEKHVKRVVGQLVRVGSRVELAYGLILLSDASMFWTCILPCDSNF